MDRNNLGHSNLLEESKESGEHMKEKQEDGFVGTAKNDHIDHSDQESSNLPNRGKKDVPKDLKALAIATKDVPKEVKAIEIKSNDIDKTGRNIGKRNRQDDSRSKTKKSSDCNVQGHGTSRSVKGRTTDLTPDADPTQYPRGKGPTRRQLPHGFV